MGGMNSVDVQQVDAIARRMIEDELADRPLQDSLADMCRDLRAAGLPLLRFNVSSRILHPLLRAVAVTWWHGQDIGLFTIPHPEGDGVSQDWETSPLKYIYTNRLERFYRRLTGPQAQLDFPILETLAARGATDYLVLPQRWQGERTEGMGVMLCWASDAPDGFTTEDQQLLQRIAPTISLLCKTGYHRLVGETVSSTYLGRQPGQLVLEGSIRRGDTSTSDAVLWYSDLRGSTTLADSLAPDDYIHLLNTYYDCSAGALLAEGGEVLQFVGDAVMAVMPVEADGLADACRRTLAAARRARQLVADANADLAARGLPGLEFGLGLHVGRVAMGNIGVPERLSFAVVGAAANEVARIEGLTKSLGEPVLVSDSFAAPLALPWRDLGRHSLRGRTEPIGVLAPPQ